MNTAIGRLMGGDHRTRLGEPALFDLAIARIRPTVVQEQLATTCFELCEVRVAGFDEAAVLQCKCKIVFQVERHRIPVRILPSDVARHVSEQGIQRCSQRRNAPAGLEPRRPSWVDCGAALGGHRRICAPGVLDLRSSETVWRVTCFASQHRGVESAGARLADNPVPDAVSLIARMASLLVVCCPLLVPRYRPADSNDTSGASPTYCSARLVIAARELVR